jgi:hypothetical protein
VAHDVNKVMASDDSGESMYVQSYFFVEVAAKDDLVACLDFGVEEAIKAIAELSVEMLIIFAISFHLEDWLLVRHCFASGSGVLRYLIG